MSSPCCYNPNSFNVYSLFSFIPLYIVPFSKYGNMVGSSSFIYIFMNSLEYETFSIAFTLSLKGLITFDKYLFSVSSSISSSLSNSVSYFTGLSTFTILTSSLKYFNCASMLLNPYCEVLSTNITCPFFNVHLSPSFKSDFVNVFSTS